MLPWRAAWRRRSTKEVSCAHPRAIPSRLVAFPPRFLSAFACVLGARSSAWRRCDTASCISAHHPASALLGAIQMWYRHLPWLQTAARASGMDTESCPPFFMRTRSGPGIVLGGPRHRLLSYHIVSLAFTLCLGCKRTRTQRIALHDLRRGASVRALQSQTPGTHLNSPSFSVRPPQPWVRPAAYREPSGSGQ